MKKDLLSDYALERTNNIMEVILSYARLEFDKKTIVGDQDDVFDAISTGVNMLGEELENSTINLKEKEQLLREKEQLLKEVHHRVKNNLQIISSLLNLQNEQNKDSGLSALIRESKNRIHTMSLIHEMLYTSSDNLSSVNINEYIRNLSRSVYATFQLQAENVVFEYDIDKEINLELDSLIPLGLILNEIITNSIKYAFPERKGKLFIQFKRSDDNYFLLVKDNGCGLPEDFEVEKAETLGIQLIIMLSEQLQAKLVLKNTDGVSYEITF